MKQLTKDFCKFEFGLIGIIITILMLAFCSCKSVEYVPVIEHKTDTLIQTKVQHDSIHVKDSTIVEMRDSIIKIEHWHTKYVKKLVRDTLYQSKTDSIPVPYPVTKYVEKKISTWQVVLMTIGGLALMALFVFIVVKLKRFLPCQ
jgi:hypothetical protein